MTKLSVVKDFPAPERTDFARFDRFDKRAGLITEQYDSFYSVIGMAEAAEESKNLERIKAAIERLEWLFRWVDRLQEGIRLCRADLSFFEPDGAFDENGEVTKAEATRHVVALLDSFPTSNITNPKVYAQTLIEEILAAETTGIPLEAACREIRRTTKAPPSIAAFLEVLIKHKKIWEERWDAVCESDDLAAHARKVHAGLLEMARDLEQEQERQAEEACIAFANAKRVQHAKFGIGRLIHQDGEQMTVEFETYGRRVLLASFVTPVPDEEW